MISKRSLFLSLTAVLYIISPACNSRPAEGIKKPLERKSPPPLQVPKNKLDREKERLSKWLDRSTGYQHVPSSAVAIVHNDEVIFVKATGAASSWPYSIASFTKIFVAVAVLHLADHGMLQLDDPVRKHLPVQLERVEIGSPAVTVRYLLNHTSGMADRGEFRTVELDPPLSLPIQRYPAGYQFSYSNAGYNLLGYLVAEVSEMNLGDYITKFILKPLGMNDSIAPRSMKGSSGMKCSIDDMAKFVRMLLGRGTFEGKKIVSQKLFDQMFDESIGIPPARFKEFRGIAWRVWTVDDKLYSYNHASLWFGSGGWIQIFPPMDVGYVFMSDTPDFRLPAFENFHNGLKYQLLRFAGLFCNGHVHPVSFKPTMPDKRLLEEFTGTYHEPLNGASIEVSLRGTSLIAVRNSRVRYGLIPTTVNTFIHKRSVSPRVLKFDFVWKDDRVVGLATRYAYYTREPDATGK
jgi:CubicO group peptidase (beta-lactamase class C family)